MSRPPHAVIFDIDGTLIDSAAADDALYRQAVRDVLGEVRFRASLDDYEHVTDSGILEQVFRDNGILPGAAERERIRQSFFAGVEAWIGRHGPFPERPGARALLERLAASDAYRVAVATGGWRRSAEIKLSAAGLPVDGLTIASADDAASRTAIMRIALSSLGHDCSPVTYYGDGAWDRAACAALGWQFRAVGPALAGLLSFDGEFTS